MSEDAENARDASEASKDARAASENARSFGNERGNARRATTTIGD